METKIPDGAQFLVIKNGQHKKVTAILGFPVDLESLMPIHRDEDSFLREGMSGFELLSANEKFAKIKLLSKDVHTVYEIHFGERIDIIIHGVTLTVELLAVRLDPMTPLNWRVSMV